MIPTPSPGSTGENPSLEGGVDVVSTPAVVIETLDQLEAWFDQELAGLEQRFAAFQTQRSVTGSLGR